MDLIRRLNKGNVIYSRPFREELVNDNLTTEDVVFVCRSGAILDPPEEDLRSGARKYRIEGQTFERGSIAIVFAFRPGDVMPIAVFKRKN